MSIVGDLREALQDVIAPDLKAVVRGLADLRDEVRGGNAALREDMRAMDKRLREEMAQMRKQADDNVASLREDTRQHIQLLREEMRGAELRSIERLENLQTVMKLELANHKVAALEAQLRARSDPAQQH